MVVSYNALWLCNGVAGKFYKLQIENADAEHGIWSETDCRDRVVIFGEGVLRALASKYEVMGRSLPKILRILSLNII